MIQIEEYRFIQLVQFEKELEQLFENIVTQYCKDWCALNPELRFRWNENKKIVADYIDQRIIDNNIIFNGKTPDVWFNMMGKGSMMYWATKDSKTISGIDKLLDQKIEEDLTYKLYYMEQFPKYRIAKVTRPNGFVTFDVEYASALDIYSCIMAGSCKTFEEATEVLEKRKREEEFHDKTIKEVVYP